jgi:hypothetical protein
MRRAGKGGGGVVSAAREGAAIRTAVGGVLASMALLHAGEWRLNEIQVIGTHNSYHVAPDAGARSLIGLFSKRGAEAWDYSRSTLDQQLDSGLRQFELDVYADPEGGRYVRQRGAEDDPMRKPGMKVLHVPGLDAGSAHPTLIGALTALRDWSLEHRRHVPVMVLLELKDTADNPLWRKPLPFDRKQMEAVEGEILAVFEREQLFLPDDMRGEKATLREAVLGKGWPTVDSLRGKILFCLDNEGSHRNIYLDGNPSLEGRLLFVSVPRDHPAAAWMKRNDPVGDFEEIRSLVREGFLVRTRADSDTQEARANDPEPRDKALASGAQFVSTDFPVADPRFSEYAVKLPDGAVARANPVLVPEGVPKGEVE